MVERKEVEDLLAAVSDGDFKQYAKVRMGTLAALCRAWLAVDGAQREVEEIPKSGAQQMFREIWSDPEFVAQVEAEKAETQAMIERHSRETDK